MPPIKRRSNITAKFSKIRGLEPEEKRIFTRIGELVDAVINNRAPTNPFSKERRIITRTDPSLPPPTGLTVQNGIRSAKLMWDPVTSNFLQFYEVKLTEEANGDETTGIAYTNTFTIKDKTGTFKADVRSVGRDGTASTFTSIEFDIQPNVILYNGEKNLTDQSGFIQITPIYCPKGYNVFLWSSMVLDSFSDPNFNVPTEIALSVENSFYSGGDYYLYNTWIQSVQGFGEEVTFTNLSVAGGGGSTNRPGGSPTRTATFQTTKVTPYAPYTVPDILGDRTNIFFVAERHRDDVVGLALNAWVCTAGIGIGTGTTGIIPVPPVVPPTPPVVIVPVTQSILWPANSTRDLINVSSNTLGLSGSSFSCFFWIKFIDFGTALSYKFWDIGVNLGFAAKALNMFLVKALNTPTSYVQFNIGFPGVANTIPLSGLTQDVWHYVGCTYDGSIQTLKIYIDGVHDATSISGTYPASFVDGRPVQLLGEALSSPVAYVANTEMFETVIWNSVLTPGEVAYIYTGGVYGRNAFDYTVNSGSYLSSANLIHWWQPGEGTLGDDNVLTYAVTLTPTACSGADLIPDYPV